MKKMICGLLLIALCLTVCGCGFAMHDSYPNADKYMIGNFTYDDYLLGFSSEDVIGVDYSLSQGPEIDYPNFKLKVQGTTRVGINNLASYFIMRGDIDYYLSFRNIHESGRINGLYELAFVYGDGEDVTLNLIIREENVGKDPKGFRGYISLTNPGVGVEFY